MGGGGATYDYGFRIYNPSIARFLSVDPLTSSYPFYTPYQYAGNSPIGCIDLDGLERAHYSASTNPLDPKLRIVPASDVLRTQVDPNTIYLNDGTREEGENFQNFLEGIGFFPVVGEVADLLNGTIYHYQKDYLNAAFSYISIIPIAGDAVGKGTKYTLKYADNVAGLSGAAGRQFASLSAATRWVGNLTKYGSAKVADALQDSRKALQKALGSAGTGKQAHHLIPVEALEKNQFVQEAVEQGFDFNGVANGLALGKNQHNGRHPNTYLSGVLNLIDRTRELNPNASAKEVMDTVAGELKTMLDGTGIKVNDLFK